MAHTRVTALIRVPGLHHWPHAHEGRQYLANTHRHLFHIKATVEVHHDERDVEFHDLAQKMHDGIDTLAAGYDPTLYHFGPRSCETLARELLRELQQDDLSVVSVEWSEDGEFSAIVYAEEASP